LLEWYLKMSEIDFDALGQAIDTTWGRSSTPSVATQSVKVLITGADCIEVRYATIVNLVHDRELVELKTRYTDESSSVIDQTLKKVKESYKEQCSKAIKFKQISEKDSFEFVNMNIHNSKRTAYFRRSVFFKVS